MIEKWLSANEIAQLLAKDKRVINRWAARESWTYRTFQERGGKHPRYHIADLPEAIQSAYAKSLGMGLEALQNELKPALKAAVKCEISGYRGRSVVGKSIKEWKDCTQAEQDIANNRQKIIRAYEESGLSAEQFVERYQQDDFMPEVKEKLGHRGRLKDFQRFYEWLRLYSQYGLSGLAPQYKGRGRSRSESY
jgi:hypothetical protein